MNTARLAFGSVLAFLAGAYLLGCSEGTEPATTPVSVEITTGDYTFTALSQTRQFSAVARDATGSVIGDASFTWSSSAPGVATVDNGLVTAIGNGEATITARSGDVSGSATATVSQEVSGVVVDPNQYTLTALDETYQLSADARDANGHSVAGQTYGWQSDDPNVVSVDSRGIVTAVANGGPVSITATTAGFSGTAMLSVVQATANVEVTPDGCTLAERGATCLLAAIARDANGNEIIGSSFAWSTSDENVATVAGGLVTAVGPGQTIITASAAGADDQTSVSVILYAQVSAGSSHTCGVTTNGTAYCWGYNWKGELGDGTTTRRSTPAEVSGGLSFASVTAGYLHSCGLTIGGAAYCWGYNIDGQLGEATTTDRLTPAAVAGGLSFVLLDAADSHTCGLTGSGTVYCWGRGSAGQLGNGTTTGKQTTPVAVTGGHTFASLSTGRSHNCGVANGATAYCWGNNTSWELGDGTGTNRSSPVAVAGGLTFTSVIAGGSHSCGVATSGRVYCWGRNTFGELGDGTYTNRSTPVEISGGLGFAALTAGSLHNCGVTSGGASYCWGYNGDGQLGDGTMIDRTTIQAIAGALSFASLSAGFGHSCGVTASGAAYCWGDNLRGQLGDGTTDDSLTPVRVVSPWVQN
jgi:alpha-tubulin suppressor-like RCC1 family protein